MAESDAEYVKNRTDMGRDVDRDNSIYMKSKQKALIQRDADSMSTEGRREGNREAAKAHGTTHAEANKHHEVIRKERGN